MIDVLQIRPADMETPSLNDNGEDPTRDRLERVVILDVLHGIKSDQIAAYKDALGLHRYAGNTEPIQITDLGCGAGFAGHIAIEEAIKHNLRANVNFVDINSTMLDYAVAQSAAHGAAAEPGQITITSKEADLREDNSLEEVAGLAQNSQDILVMKMVRHEMPLTRQYELLTEVRKALKPGGSLILWDAFIPENADGTERFNYTAFIKEKDVIQGRNVMGEGRQFTTRIGLTRMLNQVGYDMRDINNQNAGEDAPAREILSWKRNWNTIVRWIVEMKNGDVRKLLRLNRVAQAFIGTHSLREVDYAGTIREFLSTTYNGESEVITPRLGLSDDALDRHIGVQGYQFEVESAIWRLIKT